MIFGRRGDVSQAAGLFNEYYRAVFEEYNHDLEYGVRKYLHKGERLTYRNTKTNETETITAAKSGYMIIYNASRAHLSYLEKLADELGIVLCTC